MRISDWSSDVCSSDLAAGIEKAEPDRNIIGVGAKRVPRADPRQRQVEKEAIQIGIIERVTAQDQRHMRIETLGLAALANSNDRHRRETLPPAPPPGSYPHTDTTHETESANIRTPTPNTHLLCPHPLDKTTTHKLSKHNTHITKQ